MEIVLYTVITIAVIVVIVRLFIGMGPDGNGQVENVAKDTVKSQDTRDIQVNSNRPNSLRNWAKFVCFTFSLISVIGACYLFYLAFDSWDNVFLYSSAIVATLSIFFWVLVYKVCNAIATLLEK